LTLDDGVKVFLSNLGVHDKVDRSDVFVSVFGRRREWQETVVEVLGGEGSEG
jgi:hypothetical protein